MAERAVHAVRGLLDGPFFCFVCFFASTTAQSISSVPLHKGLTHIFAAVASAHAATIVFATADPVAIRSTLRARHSSSSSAMARAAQSVLPLAYSALNPARSYL